MASPPADRPSPAPRQLLHRGSLALLSLLLALGALWLGMSVPAYFRSISPLVLEAAAEATPTLPQAIDRHLDAGRPGIALPLIEALESVRFPNLDPTWRVRLNAIIEQEPAYRWSGGPAPYFEQFLARANALRPDTPHVIPALLPAAHRTHLRGFLEQSPNQLVQRILATAGLSGWQRFYPVHSTAGQPLEATLLCVALLEQASAFPDQLRDDLLRALATAEAPAPSIAPLESFYLSILTLATRANWLQLRDIIETTASEQELLQFAQILQEEAANIVLLSALLELFPDSAALAAYLRKHGEPGWKSVLTTLPLGRGATEALVRTDRPVYLPPALWTALPTFLKDGQPAFKHFAESVPTLAISLRALAFFLCGFGLVHLLRCLIVAPPKGPAVDRRRRLLLNLDTSIGGVLVMLLLWMVIEPGLLNFRPNEEGVLQIRLAQIVPDLPTEVSPLIPETMIDQVTLLILLLFLLIQLLVFVFGLLKISEVRRRDVSPEVKLRLLDNEENLFDLGLYVGLGGTVSSLILVVLNIVDASLMAAYASTLFGIIFVALLKVAFLRPYRRSLILSNA